jgi:hypothetical protein
MGPSSSQPLQGHVAAAESICMNLHLLDKVLYGGITISKVLYEFAHHGQGFVPMVQLPLFYLR